MKNQKDYFTTFGALLLFALMAGTLYEFYQFLTHL